MKKFIFLLPLIVWSCGDDKVYDSKIEELDFYNRKNADLQTIEADLEKENKGLQQDIDLMNL